MEDAAKELGYHFSGVETPAGDRDVYALRYSEFVVPLVKAVQELSKENAELKKNAEEQQCELVNIKQQLAELRALVVGNTQLSMYPQPSWERTAPTPHVAPLPFVMMFPLIRTYRTFCSLAA